VLYPPAPEPAALSTDHEYLADRYSYYSRGWLGAWGIERIRDHRDGHQNGRIWMGKRLARAMYRDADIVAALRQRTAAAMGIEHILEGGSDELRGDLARGFGKRGVIFTAAAQLYTLIDLAMCGVAILQNVWRPRKDGTAWDFVIRPWNLESVDYDSYHECYYAHTRERGRVPVVHGDGKWVVVRATLDESHDLGAVIPLALPFAGNGFNLVDRAGASKAIGSPKLLGQLPPNQAPDSPEGREFQTALEGLMSGRATNVRPDKTDIKPLEFNGNGWQIFDTAGKTYTQKIFFALTGQDGTAKNEGGSYVKAKLLAGVLFAVVEADLLALGSGVTSGSLRPYAEINTGDPDAAPSLAYPLPDPEEDARLAALAERHAALAERIDAYRDAGVLVDQALVDRLARELRVEPAPRLAELAA